MLSISKISDLALHIKKNQSVSGSPGSPFEADFAKIQVIADSLYPLTGNNWIQESKTNLSQDSAFTISKLDLEGLLYPFVRGDCFLPSESIARVAAVIRNPIFRHEWDADFDSATTLQFYDQGQSILIYTSKKAKFPASARDLIISIRFVKKDDGCMDILGSVDIDTDSDAGPVSEGKVRATALSASWRLVQKDKGVQLTYIAHANPGGTLPSAMFRMVLSGLAKSQRDCQVDHFRKDWIK